MAYKNDLSCVYQIKCLANGKIYIGSTVGYNRRTAAHKRYFINNKHKNHNLQKDYNKYGLENFEFTILEKCDNNSILIREREFIKKLNPEYNSKIHGSHPKLTYYKTQKIIKNIKILDNGCWSYCNNIKDRYSHINIDRKNYKAHRIIYLMFNGNFDESLVLCHKCDNKYCINPSHLFLGTHCDNARDYRDKFGNKNKNVKTSFEYIKENNLHKFEMIVNIRKDYNIGLTYQEMHEKYNLHQSSILDISLNKKFHDPLYKPKNRIEKINEKIIQELRNDYLNNIKPKKLSEKYNLPYHTINNIITNNNYKDPDYQIKLDEYRKSKKENK